MWRGDIYIYYKEGTLPNPDSGDKPCFEIAEAPNRDMALMQVTELHARHGVGYQCGEFKKGFHPESVYAPRFDTITGFKFRAYPKRCASAVCRVEEIKNG